MFITMLNSPETRGLFNNETNNCFNIVAVVLSNSVVNFANKGSIEHILLQLR